MIRIVLIVLTVSFGMYACGSGEAPPAEEAAVSETETPSGPLQYQVLGKIEAIDVAAGRVTIAHQDIPGFMNAMTMAFDVNPPSLLEGLAAGEFVEFLLVVETDGTYYITEIGEPPTN
jgi:protein SCO1/2